MNDQLPKPAKASKIKEKDWERTSKIPIDIQTGVSIKTKNKNRSKITQTRNEIQSVYNWKISVNQKQEFHVHTAIETHKRRKRLTFCPYEDWPPYAGWPYALLPLDEYIFRWTHVLAMKPAITSSNTIKTNNSISFLVNFLSVQGESNERSAASFRSIR